jgi:hypothetical protein
MARFFAPNITRLGRGLRALYGLILLLGGLGLLKYYPVASVFLFCFSAFAFYEALRGWCLLRACGVKTKY